MTLYPDEVIITSYDVTTLFTSIPPNDAINITKEYLESDTTLKDRTALSIDDIIECVELCLQTTYFSNNGRYYRQMHGCSMGAPISPILANLVMEWFEQKALTSYTGTTPRLWLRFVDDTFVIINRNELEPFFKYINSINPNIKFTQEECTDGKLAFLDCLIKVDDERKL